jgi:hypothetical protein
VEAVLVFAFEQLHAHHWINRDKLAAFGISSPLDGEQLDKLLDAMSGLTQGMRRPKDRVIRIGGISNASRSTSLNCVEYFMSAAADTACRAWVRGPFSTGDDHGKSAGAAMRLIDLKGQRFGRWHQRSSLVE